MENVLITDAQLRAALAIIRSLGKKNIKVTAISERENAIGLHSRYCDEKLIFPNPRTQTEEYIKKLVNLVEKRKFSCIIPSHTYTALLLLKYKNLFGETKIPPPNIDIFKKVYLKNHLLQTAEKNNINIPKTYFDNDIDDLINKVEKYPVVIKSSVMHGVGINICKDSRELKDKYQNFKSKYGACMVQEYIENGGEYGVYSLFNNKSDPIALSVQERIRCMYDYGGISTLRKSVKNDRLVNIAFKLLKKLKWSGVAMVEFRFDDNDNEPKLMEINPRFWGSLQLSINTGTDFPFLLYKLITDNDTTCNLNYKTEVQCRWLIGEIIGFSKNPKKIEIMKDIIPLRRNYDIISLKDPLPMFVSFFLPPPNPSDEGVYNSNSNDISLKKLDWSKT